jgi:hypothetical protein
LYRRRLASKFAVRRVWKNAGETPAPRKYVDIESWAARIRAGDVRAISRAITAIEDHDPQSEDLLQQIFPTQGRIRL